MGCKIKQVSHNRDCLSPLPRDQDSGLTSQYRGDRLYVIKPVKKNQLWIGLAKFCSNLLLWRSEVMSQGLEERVPMGLLLINVNISPFLAPVLGRCLTEQP